MTSAVYGKTIENLRKRVNVRLVMDDETVKINIKTYLR